MNRHLLGGAYDEMPTPTGGETMESWSLCVLSLSLFAAREEEEEVGIWLRVDEGPMGFVMRDMERLAEEADGIEEEADASVREKEGKKTPESSK